MLFSSLTFLYRFLPAVVILYAAVPKKFKNAVLLIASLIFYGWGEPRFLIVMLISIACGFVFGLLIDRTRGTPRSRLFLILSVTVSLGFLVYFKYAGFFVRTLNALGLGLPLVNIALPIGISFYTFQLVGYAADVYTGRAEACRNPLDFAAYTALFPQLIAGPIVRYRDIAGELKSRVVTPALAAEGTGRFITGLGKKVLLANAFGELAGVCRGAADPSVLTYWLYAGAVTLQTYFDFSGYSDMAIGLGRLFGFHFPEHFDYPYTARSITEFCRRWHITLGRWFRDYVYIPLGGSRVKAGRHIVNILVVWMLTGFWHGADWQFILWGLFYGLLLILEKYGLRSLLPKLPAAAAHLYVMAAVIIGFVIFHSAGPAEAAADLGAMFGAGGLPLISAEAWYYLRSYAVLLVIGIIGATPFVRKVSTPLSGSRAGGFLRCLWQAAVLLLVTAYLVDGSFNPFLYFRF